MLPVIQGQEMKIIVISTVLTEWVDRYETKVLCALTSFGA